MALADDKVRNYGFERVRRSTKASIASGAPPPPFVAGCYETMDSGDAIGIQSKDFGMRRFVTSHPRGWSGEEKAFH